MIYTRTGDKGETSLIRGGRFPKSHYIFEILGSIDELNSTLGFLSEIPVKDIKTYANDIQVDLFEISSYIAEHKAIKQDAKVKEMEKLIDTLDSKLPALKNFILSGGSRYAVYLHLCRSLCRKVERQVVKAKMTTYTPYFNRLSDLLFILARYTNMRLHKKDVKWIRK